MNNKVYGVLGIKAKMANFNADFSGDPKSISTGEIFASDKALKYASKSKWSEEGHKVLYIKSLTKREKDNKLGPCIIEERYENLFEESLKKSDRIDVLKNLFSTIDVKQFGATFAAEGKNFGITGAVQVGQGMNKYNGINIERQEILSPFATDITAEQTSIGRKVIADEAHYVYPFAINPIIYKEYMELGITNGYTLEDYNEFKKSALIAVTALNTNSKLGCENELAVFIETKDDLYLPPLDTYVEFKKGIEGEKDTIVLHFSDLVNNLKDSIVSIEIYYNDYTTNLEHTIQNASTFNIFTKEDIK
jgi:CRISPR-associated protein Csh2